MVHVQIGVTIGVCLRRVTGKYKLGIAMSDRGRRWVLGIYEGNIILSTIHQAAAAVQNSTERCNRCKERFLTIKSLYFLC